MSRCPGCNKFATLDEPEVEDSGFEADGTTIHVTATLVRNSVCCGDEIRRIELEADVEVAHECPNADILGREVFSPDAGESFEITEGFTDPEGELEAYVEDGRKAQVGATGTITTRCTACGEECSIDLDQGTLAALASEMEEVA